MKEYKRIKKEKKLKKLADSVKYSEIYRYSLDMICPLSIDCERLRVEESSLKEFAFNSITNVCDPSSGEIIQKYLYLRKKEDRLAEKILIGSIVGSLSYFANQIAAYTREKDEEVCCKARLVRDLSDKLERYIDFQYRVNEGV